MAFSSNADPDLRKSLRTHSSAAQVDYPTGMSRQWGKMMVGTASAGIGMVQLVLGIWLGGLFSVTLAGALWCGVALKRRNESHAQEQALPLPLGLCVGRSLLLASAGMLGSLILFY